MAETRWKHSFHDGVQLAELKSWEFFDDYVREEMLDFRQYVWRGQASADWLLEPTLDRILRSSGTLSSDKVRDDHLRRFKYATRGRRGQHPPVIATENEWWALGQHHGLATPLLDWTRSPFVAAYFAFLGDENNGANRRAIWGISQTSVTKKSKEIAASHTGAGRAPIIEFVEPQSDENARLVNQNGLFTRGPDGKDLEAWIVDNFPDDTMRRLIKLTIPEADRTVALRSLNRMNINHLSLFPDLFGASKFANLDLRIKNY
jgi:hypothetical protein